MKPTGSDCDRTRNRGEKDGTGALESGLGGWGSSWAGVQAVLLSEAALLSRELIQQLGRPGGAGEVEGSP
jgi:hypothetical protein